MTTPATEQVIKELQAVKNSLEGIHRQIDGTKDILIKGNSKEGNMNDSDWIPTINHCLRILNLVEGQVNVVITTMKAHK